MNPSQEKIGPVEVVDSMDNMEFDVDEDIFRAEYDSSRDQPCLAIVAVVATATNSDPIELSPLHSAIDTEALDDLLSETVPDDQRDICLSFSYEGVVVTAFSKGTIEVSPMETT